MKSATGEKVDVQVVPEPTAHVHIHGPSGVNQQAVRRLKSIAGQVDGIKRMVEEEKYCIDILTQISAVRAALNSVGQVILKRHIETCVSDAIEIGGANKTEIIDELMTVFARGEI